MMDYDIEYIRLPRGAVAAVSKRRVQVYAFGGAYIFSGSKAPVAFLLQDACGLLCRDAQGGSMSADAVERLCPGILREFAAFS